MTDDCAMQARLRLRGETGCERIAMAAVAAAARRAGLPPSRLADAETAVAEVCLNGLEHGSPGKSSGCIDIVLGVQRDSFRVIVRDGGRGFDPERVATPSMARALGANGHQRGWGLFLVRQLADRVDVRVGRTGCAVELHFRLGSGVGRHDG